MKSIRLSHIRVSMDPADRKPYTNPHPLCRCCSACHLLVRLHAACLAVELWTAALACYAAAILSRLTQQLQANRIRETYMNSEWSRDKPKQRNRFLVRPLDDLFAAAYILRVAFVLQFVFRQRWHSRLCVAVELLLHTLMSCLFTAIFRTTTA